MFNRQQLLLQQMGIRHWIPRQQITAKKTSDVLWRDQLIEIGLPLHQIKATQQIPPLANNEEKYHEDAKTNLQNVVTHSKDTQLQNSINPQIETKTLNRDDLSVSENNLKVIKDIENAEISQKITFQFDVLIHENFLIFAEIHNELEAKLFWNIQKACFAEHHLLHWPLHIQRWESSDLMLESYLQGFFAFHAKKTLFFMGDLALNRLDDDLLPHDVLKNGQCASLQQLIDSPEQKRALWQKLYPLIYAVE